MITDMKNISLEGFFIAEVMINNDPDNEGRVAVYLPQLMYDNEINETPYENNIEVEASEDLLINSDDFENSEIEESNYIWARPLMLFQDNEPNWEDGNKYINSGSLRVPRIGDRVLIIFIGSDLQKCYYFPYSPTVKGQKLDTKHAMHPEELLNPAYSRNVDTIRLYWDDMRIEADTNTHEMRLITKNGNYIKLSEKDIEIKGDVHMLNKLIVEEDTLLKSKLDVNGLTTCHNMLKVENVTYIYQELFNKGINLTTHIHEEHESFTSSPIK